MAPGSARRHASTERRSRHSQLIEARPVIAVTVFDTHAVPNEGTGFYATAQARRCPDEQVDDGLRILSRRLAAYGIGGFTRERGLDREPYRVDALMPPSALIPAGSGGRRGGERRGEPTGRPLP